MTSKEIGFKLAYEHYEAESCSGEDADRLARVITRAIEEATSVADIQSRESDNMISVLIQYIHDLKRHQVSIQFCKEEPCPATLEFIGRAANRKIGHECTCSIDGTPFCKAKGTGYCLAENPS